MAVWCLGLCFIVGCFYGGLVVGCWSASLRCVFVLRGLLLACFDCFAVAYMFIACCFLVAYCDLLCWLRLLGCGLECDALIVLVTCFIVFGVVCYVVLTSWGFVGFGVALFVLVVWVWCLLRLRW